MADQTVSTNYEPWLQVPYQYLVNTALGQAQQPYQAYGGQGVAPMTQQQLQAMQGVGGYNILPTLENWMTQTQNAGNISSASQAAPWFQGAAGSLGGAGTSLGSGAMALGQSGNALGAASNTINSFNAAAPWLNNAGSNLASVDAISGRGAANPYALMATASPGALQAASPYLQQASQSGVGGISSYLNPYNTAVNDALAQQSARNVSENLLPKVNSTFTGAGQFGSSRNADITGRVLRDANESLLNQQSANLQSGFNTAANLSQQDLSRQAGLAATAGGLQGTDLSRYLGAGQLALSGATTDINKGLGISGQLGSLGQTAGNMANIDAQRQLGIAQGYQGISQGQQGIAQGWGNIANAQAGIGNSMGNLTNVDANRLLSAAAQGTNQGLAQQGVYNQGIDRLYGYGSALQGQNQNENAWNYNQWQQQQQYPWDQLNNLSAILGGARPGGTVQSSSGGSGSNLNSILGAGLGLIAAKPWSWFADGGRVPGYANGGITNALDSLADTFESPLMQAALSLVGSKGSRTGDAVGSAIQAAAKANTNADAKKLRKMQMDLLKARIPTPQSALTPGRSSAGGSGIMQGVRPYWDDTEAVGYADGGAVDDEEGGILSAFSRAGNWLDRVTGGSGIEAGPLDKRYAELVGGNLPERPAINSPLMQAAAALLTSKQKRPLAAIGEGLSALTQGSENQRKLALGEQALKAQILGALQKENDPSKLLKEVNGRLYYVKDPTRPVEVAASRPMAATPFGIEDTAAGPQANPQALAALGALKGVDTKAALDEYGAKKDVDLRVNPQIAGREAMARVPAALNEYGGKANIDLATKPQLAGAEEAARQMAQIRTVAPGAELVAPAPGGGVQQIYKSGSPAPGTQEGALQKGIGEEGAKVVADWRTNANAASQAKQAAVQQRQALENGLQTGAFADVRYAVANALNSTGQFDPKTIEKISQMTDYRKFEAATNEMIQQVAKTLGANPTDNDARLLAKTFAQTKDPREAARALIDYQIKKADQRIMKFQEGWDAVTNKGVNPLQFESDWNKRILEGSDRAAQLRSKFGLE